MSLESKIINRRLLSKELSRLLWLSVVLISCNQPRENIYTTWDVYNGTKAGMKYSSLTQVNATNVSQLAVVWEYHTGDADTVHQSQMQVNPVIVDGMLYGVTPRLKLFAVDAATGEKHWVFEPDLGTISGESEIANHNCRGVAYWTDGKDKRLYYTAASKTFAVNAITGKEIETFGNGGWIDMHDDLGRDVKDLLVVNTSPGIIYKDLLILGSRVDESHPSAPGHIRAYNVRTGKLVWIFHTIPQPGEFGHDTWEDPKAWEHIGGANVWSGFSLDEERGILFAPTGSAAFDFYGGKRKGANLFANCLLAIDAATGKLIWHYQVVHHDLWDKDIPAPPVLVTLRRDGKPVDAVAQTTKNGQVFVFERETGKPLYDIDEVPVDTVSGLTGEKVWPTQPVPRKPAPFARQTLTENDLNPYLADSIQERLRNEIKRFRHGNMFLPPGKSPSLVFPGFDGGGEWGGPAVDPETGILYVNSNEMAWILEMKETRTRKPERETWLKAGKRLYQHHCIACHGAELKGGGDNPSLVDLKARYNEQEFLALINNGRRMMPAYRHLGDEEKEAIASFVLDIKSDQNNSFEFVATSDERNKLPYDMNGYIKFLGGDYPAISPPWGMLSAIDLNTGEFVWKEVLGEYPELTKKGRLPTGTENYGGPVVTAGGLVFIAATRDSKFRAFDKNTGKLLWEYDLPAPAFATPAVYEMNGREYIVVACGGGKLNTRSADVYVAFALPDSGFGRKEDINSLSKKEIRDGWVLLFDGISSNGWVKFNGDPFPSEGWVIRDGLLTLGEGQIGGDIKTTDEFSDFEFSVDFLYTPACNSGIKYFYTNYKKGGYLGMEYQLLDDALAEDNNRADHQCGALYDIFPPDSSRKRLKGPGEWNRALIISKGMHVEHWLNGKKIVEFERGSAAYLAGVAKSKYKTEPVFGMIEKGNILLQDHGHRISFRNIKIRRL